MTFLMNLVVDAQTILAESVKGANKQLNGKIAGLFLIMDKDEWQNTLLPHLAF